MVREKQIINVCYYLSTIAVCPPSELNKQQEEQMGRPRNREPEEWENGTEERQLSGEHKREKGNKVDHCHKIHIMIIIKNQNSSNMK